MLDQVVNAVGLTIWLMLIGLATWSMMRGGLMGIDAGNSRRCCFLGRRPQLDILVDAGRLDQLVSYLSALKSKRALHQSPPWLPTAIPTWRPVKRAFDPSRAKLCQLRRGWLAGASGPGTGAPQCLVGVPSVPRRCLVDVLSVSLRCSVGVTPNESSNEHANE